MWISHSRFEESVSDGLKTDRRIVHTLQVPLAEGSLRLKLKEPARRPESIKAEKLISLTCYIDRHPHHVVALILILCLWDDDIGGESQRLTSIAGYFSLGNGCDPRTARHGINDIEERPPIQFAKDRNQVQEDSRAAQNMRHYFLSKNVRERYQSKFLDSPALSQKPPTVNNCPKWEGNEKQL